MNRDCERIIGPCTCGAWHVSSDEFDDKEPCDETGDAK